MDKLWHDHVMESCAAGKELLLTCNNVDESPKRYAEWKKPVLEDYTLYRSIRWHSGKDDAGDELISGCQEVWGEGGTTKECPQRVFWGFGTGLYPVWGGSYTAPYMS